MEFNTTIMCEKITKYLSNEFSKEDFSKWAYETMYKLLKGDILKIENIALWKFVTLLTRVDDSCQPCSENDIREILRIINGYENAFYLFHMKIPKEFQNLMMVRIYDLLIKHSNSEEINSLEINEIKSFIYSSLLEASTIIDLFKIQISKLLSSSYSFYEENNSITFDLDSIVFIKENEIVESEYLLKILHLLECAIGNKCFSICVNYLHGLPNVSIIC
jgi:hypothetical protein